MKMDNKVKESLDTVLKAFETGEITKAIAYGSIACPSNLPMSKWTMSNKAIVVLRQTIDARGFKQWKEVERKVKKGSKAVFIFAPRIKTVERENPETGEMEKESYCIGFLRIPVFRIEDTTGKPVDNPLQDIPLPPLHKVAEQFGVSVNYGYENSKYAGFYRHDNKSITLCTKNENVFFHELAHAAHYRVKGIMQVGDKNKKECVAELTACVISHVYGKDYSGNAYRYIARYAGNKGKNVYPFCMAVLNDVELCLNEIFKGVDLTGVKSEEWKVIA